MMANFTKAGRKADYITIQGKELFIDENLHDYYTKETGAKILCENNGKEWGYTDDGKLIKT